MAQTDIPEEFACPACGGDVAVSVAAFVRLSTLEVVPGSDMRLHAGSFWECLSCQAEGPLRDDGPWFHAGRNYDGVDPTALEERSV